MILQKRAGVSTEEVGGQVVVLDAESQEVHQLNKTAGFIWSLIDGSSSPRAMAERLADRFEVDPQTALADVEKILERLRQAHLVVGTERSP